MAPLTVCCRHAFILRDLADSAATAVYVIYQDVLHDYHLIQRPGSTKVLSHEPQACLDIQHCLSILVLLLHTPDYTLHEAGARASGSPSSYFHTRGYYIVIVKPA